ncbi:hypothetical protein EGJ86_05250 [Pseudomonas sp. o96-267]|uniref:hypothetical protein n=1 Tax=Pseudomonas sp. o96-267 TaxID=2479853 RepID=UPI000F7969A5|nr:hypothetical protein [Pseudomonas sp. o96-267]RRV42120.1 hypothetical protein EGJ86_05250 [Pseudomonas sp. o96-267]
MIDAFKNEMLNFIMAGGVDLPSPDVIKTEFDGEKTSTSHYCYISMGGGPTPVGFFLKHILIYSLLDAVFESEIPDLEDKGFMAKYKRLPESDEYEKSVKETYRILTFVRNVAVHNKSKLTIENGRIGCSYKKWNQRKKNDIPLTLDIGYEGLAILYSIAVMRAKLKGDVDRYHRLLISAMYESALSEINIFDDEYKYDCGIGITNFSLDRKILWRRRYRIASPILKDEGDFIRFSRMPAYEDWASDEYLLERGEDKYIIPGEFLLDDGRLPKEELESWRLLNKVIMATG